MKNIFQIVIIILTISATSLYAQWWRPIVFDRVTDCVYFNEHTEGENIGFALVGSFDSRINWSEVWKTTNKGISWYKVFDSTDHIAIGMTDITFKDSLTGWICMGYGSFNKDAQGVLKTTDAGETWSYQPHHNPGLYGKYSNAIYYKPDNKKLLLSTLSLGVYEGLSYSDDEGASWGDYTVNRPLQTTGTVFINDNIGVVSTIGTIDPSVETYPWYKTTDGGLSWNKLSIDKPVWQPLAIQESSLIYAVSYIFESKFYRSTDAGETWDTLVDFGTDRMTGTVRGDLSRLYIQGWHPHIGIMTSEDSGRTFASICGPHRYLFSRFYVTKNKYCYANDVLNEPLDPYSSIWVNTTGKGSGKRILLSASNIQRELSISIGNTGEIVMSLPDTLPTLPLLLDSLTIVLNYNTDLLTRKKIIPTSDWSLVSSKETEDKLYIQLQRVGFTDPNGKEIARVSFQANLSDTTEASIIVDSVFYNQGEIVNCSPIAEEEVHVTVEDACGDSLIRTFLLTQKLVDLVNIYPNPTDGDVTIDFTSVFERDLTLQVLDDLGRVVQEEDVHAMKGSNTHIVLIPSQWSGIFYLRLQTGNDVVTGKFVKQ